MFKVGIIGPESTGKSTLAKDLAARHGGHYIAEYARDFVAQKGRTDVTFEELCSIARRQIEQLRSLPDGLYFFDTELIVTKVWFDYAFGEIPVWLEEAIRAYPMDVYLLTKPDIPWIADPTRSNGSEAIRQELFERYEKEIQLLDIPYYIITHI